MSADVLHVIDEAKSPPDASIWVMWCGASCFVLGDGPNGGLVPYMDFYGEDAAEKATCEACRHRFGPPASPRAELVKA